jgi:hypothetical protein
MWVSPGQGFVMGHGMPVGETSARQVKRLDRQDLARASSPSRPNDLLAGCSPHLEIEHAQWQPA